MAVHEHTSTDNSLPDSPSIDEESGIILESDGSNIRNRLNPRVSQQENEPLLPQHEQLNDPELSEQATRLELYEDHLDNAQQSALKFNIIVGILIIMIAMLTDFHSVQDYARSLLSWCRCWGGGGAECPPAQEVTGPQRTFERMGSNGKFEAYSSDVQSKLNDAYNEKEKQSMIDLYIDKAQTQLVHINLDHLTEFNKDRTFVREMRHFLPGERYVNEGRDIEKEVFSYYEIMPIDGSAPKFNTKRTFSETNQQILQKARRDGLTQFQLKDAAGDDVDVDVQPYWISLTQNGKSLLLEVEYTDSNYVFVNGAYEHESVPYGNFFYGDPVHYHVEVPGAASKGEEKEFVLLTQTQELPQMLAKWQNSGWEQPDGMGGWYFFDVHKLELSPQMQRDWAATVKKEGGEANLKILYHALGDISIVYKIQNEGFKMEFNKVDDYGKGNYFATEPGIARAYAKKYAKKEKI